MRAGREVFQPGFEIRGQRYGVRASGAAAHRDELNRFGCVTNHGAAEAKPQHRMLDE